MENKKEYNSCLDFLKGIACILIVFSHCMFPGTLGIAVKAMRRFCVPFFFMVSGYFYMSDKTLNVKERKRKVWHICKITFWATLFYLVFGIIQTVLYPSSFEPFSWKDILIFLGCNKTFFITGEMWFLYALLYVYLVLVFVNPEWYRRNSGKIAVVCLTLYVFLAQGLYVVGYSLQNIVYKNWLIEGLGFFSLGFVLHQHQEKLKISNQVLWVIIILSTILSLVERYYLGRNFGVNISSIPQVLALMIYAINNPLRHEGWIQRLGRDCSLMIYILHPAIGQSMDHIYQLIGIWDNMPARYLEPLLVVVLSILSAIAFNAIVRLCNQSIAAKLA